ncbi:GNAT family N-acetyltransferase [Alteromonas flava]|uniref:GNAT family N-acetyltransferase n=1 Tax=Alteromonas flava TaxID=2048003 RepID=UPI000C291653|nr:GNAT family N-acetyltransferase [Alteromonas flava]
MRLEKPLVGYQVTLRNVEVSDLEQLRAWRNSEHVKRFMLTTNNISCEQQHAWFEHIGRATNQIHFVIEYRGGAIGSCNIKTRGQGVDINNAEHFELGLYIGDQRYAGNLVAFSPTLVMNDYCFSELNAKLLHAVVKSDNVAALRYNEQLGYTVTQQGDLVDLILTEQNYAHHAKGLKALLKRPPRDKK